MMGGTVDVASEYGRGSTFTVRLPADVRLARAPASDAEPLKEEAGEPGEGARLVLVIDDDPAVRTLMRRFLSRGGFRVADAADGETGIRLARELKPDVITLDVLMPVMDGWAVLTAIKNDETLAAIPVVLQTIVDDPQMGFALGASEYLTKPIDRKRLLALLERYVPADAARRVLLVDDDVSARATLGRALRRAGWHVTEAENGRVALDRLAESAPALVLLDLMMPEMDGFEFLDAMRRNEAWRGIPVIVVTAKTLTDEDRRRLNGGVERVMQKGAFNSEALMNEIRSLVAAR
jgi:CheY-like chemotaxis protein